MTRVVNLNRLLFLLLISLGKFAHADRAVYLTFDCARAPMAVLWWNDDQRFIEPVEAKDLGHYFIGVAAKPVSAQALSYIVFEKSHNGLTPLTVENGKLITHKQLEEARFNIQKSKREITNIDIQMQSKRIKVSELRVSISQKIPIEEILSLRREKSEIDVKKRQVDSESQVVEMSLKNLDQYRMNPEEISSQERQLQQVNQELRIGANGRKSVS